MENESLIDEKEVIETEKMGLLGLGQRIFGIPIAHQRKAVWLLALLFLGYSYTQGQIGAGILGLVVAYVINR